MVVKDVATDDAFLHQGSVFGHAGPNDSITRKAN